MLTTYHIMLQGHLRREWFATASPCWLPDGTTRLTLCQADQAALFGVLLKIRDLGIPLLAVYPVSTTPSQTAEK